MRRDSVGPDVVVRRAGRRRLWDELVAAHAWWRAEGEPGIEDFGLTVTARGRTTAWPRSPDRPVPVRWSPERRAAGTLSRKADIDQRT
ncbi:hypothetical protein [Streptomyces johnsoniae]|uniref:Uncharacterized protein n=1 Tax=Streptomyces johnsoniae TaxID=3075532 RepID=A0ABU2RYW1_9ACTN|nr:hypothetical protein [Streptomyces sp. DSM 41886]MDT0441954.1 hypothetical protein [Streptomyces sp. DSM 41886]